MQVAAYTTMETYQLFPDIHLDRIAFVADDEIWEYETGRGSYQKILSNFGAVTNLRFSPDGKHIYFCLLRGTEATSSEVFKVSSSGGTPIQVTFFGSPSLGIAGFSKDGKLIVTTDSLSPFRRASELIEIDEDTGSWKPLNLGPATTILYSDKYTILGRNTFDIPNWKHYRGGLRGKIWVRSDGDQFRKLLDLDGNITSITYAGNRIFFTSDYEGTGELYSVDIRGRDIRKHTSSGTYYARNVRSDGHSIVFQSGGEIFYMADEGSSPEKLNLAPEIGGLQTSMRFADPSHFLTDFSVSPDSFRVSFVSRGHSFVMSPEHGPVVELGSEEKGRIKSLIFIPGSNNTIGISDEDGEDGFSIYDLNGELVRRIKIERGLIRKAYASPDGKKLAFSNSRYELFVLDLSNDSIDLVARSEYGFIDDFSWHRNSKYIAYSFPESRSQSSIFVADADRLDAHRVTTGGYRDYSPSFDPKGRYLYYLSQRDLDPVYDKIVFELGYPMAARPYFVTLDEKVKSPLLSNDLTETYSEISFQGITGRVGSFPMEVSDYTRLEAAEESFYTLKFPVEGSMKYYLWSSAERSSGILENFDLKRRRGEIVATGLTDFKLSPDLKHMLIKSQGKFFLMNLPQKDIVFPTVADPSKAVPVDLQRIKLRVHPRSEWKQMFREAWIRMREFYWNPDRIGSFWNDTYTKYEKLLPRITTRYALSDLIREMQGELGTSHSYEIGGEMTTVPNYSIGRLGADFQWNGSAFMVSRIYCGDESSPGEKSPLLLPGIDVRSGDLLLSVNGIRVGKDMPPNAALLNHSGEDVQLEFYRDGHRTFFTVPAIPDDRSIRYRDWVEDRKKYVHKKTDGKVGYIHIPDMGPNGFNEFHRLLESETKYEGLIVDVRFNGGGHVSQLLLEKLARKRIGFDQPRRGPKIPYPDYSVAGPMIAVTNEFAGSDGDIFSHSWKLFGLGPLVGTRTWGGVVGINTDSTLVDGTIVTQPEFSFSFIDVGFGVENYGTDPTIEVEPSPDDYLKNSDPQLDRAIGEIMEMMKNKK
jgi:tricorn protease